MAGNSHYIFVMIHKRWFLKYFSPSTNLTTKN